MKAATLLFIFVFSVASESWGSLRSQFLPTVYGTTIPNTHALTKKVLRGAAPLGKSQELVDLGVTDVLIFKNQTRKEVEQEKSELKKAGFTDRQIHHIPFRWKDFDDIEDACVQVVEGLRILRRVESRPGRKIFFHCTMGEDRTGLLAGLFRMWNEGLTTEEVFYDEMCPHGYGSGNPNKPYEKVVKPIQEELTPIFLAIAQKIEAGEMDELSPAVCERLEFTQNPGLYCR